ncbi:MAG: response regulator, partial [Pseudomonadota bacterium]
MAHILLAEDDASMRQFLTAALERVGHKVTPCEDGLHALKEAEDNSDDIDLLLADIVMPGIDGIELSQRIADLNSDIKVVFITGFSG